MKRLISIFLLAVVVVGCTVMMERVDDSTGEKYFAGYANTSLFGPIAETALEYNPTTKEKRFMVSVKTINFTRREAKFDIRTIEIAKGKKSIVLKNQGDTHYEQVIDDLVENRDNINRIEDDDRLYIQHTSTAKATIADDQLDELEEIIMSSGSLILLTDDEGNQLLSKFTKKGGMKKLFNRIREEQ